MTDRQRTRLSKFLSLILRHDPALAGLTLEVGGWVLVSDLLTGMRRAGHEVTPEQLNEIVATSDKNRFGLDETGQKIRANQGHSVGVDLQLEPQSPPAILYHGTSEAALPFILSEGITKQSRHHVHLSTSFEQALIVGQRHGTPVVLAVDATAMHAAGLVFFVATNGVWLTDAVPTGFFQIIPRSPARA